MPPRRGSRCIRAASTVTVWRTRLPVMNQAPQSGAKHVAVVLFFWLTTGFLLGTGTLLGPVRWTASHARSVGWSQTGENAAIVGIIAAFICVSGLLAFRLARVVSRARGRLVRWGWPLAVSLAAAAMLHLWLTPSLLSGSSGGVTEAGPRFTFGPYPDEKRLRELEAEGYTAVISLLHPAVVPFEPILIADEERAARRAGRAVHFAARRSRASRSTRCPIRR